MLVLILVLTLNINLLFNLLLKRKRTKNNIIIKHISINCICKFNICLRYKYVHANSILPSIPCLPTYTRVCSVLTLSVSKSISCMSGIRDLLEMTIIEEQCLRYIHTFVVYQMYYSFIVFQNILYIAKTFVNHS